MSDTDSFIDEVTEEVKRDRLFAMMKRYGWIAVLIVLLLVGGTAWREYQISSRETAAQAFGDSVLDAMDVNDAAAKAAALEDLSSDTPSARAVLEMLTADAEQSSGETPAAVARLQGVAADTAVPNIYRQIASYKAMMLGFDVLPVEERRAGLEALAVPGQPLRLLAEEQLALVEIEVGEREAALTRLQAMLDDSEITAGLRRRASQLIVALGGEMPES
ncbi:tetratricopeptide repeat protein [Sagittula stellata]|uniref:Ancillary SecYEG translocon subunit/Cell division coordinator CpoB TPR domain-containing protein n=1 Tax=Sagittula stellata (strain ATCC 700073 / DSM 11524 / E-37) TaxID=388399 RepID=A3K9Z2_SAGS3|nr:tetratricopeptide repeat protein [Sagittula stellata]EBA05935.1 hypothetical protein SSE37_25043 [Sagittula stellata E-37]